MAVLNRPLRSSALLSAGLVLVGAFAVTLLQSEPVRADAETEARYPFDPACPWGRVANGQGMLKRCVTETEAKRLVEGLDKGKSGTSSSCTPGPTGPSTPAVAPSSTAPVASVSTTAKPSEPTPVTPEPSVAKGPRPFSIKLASIVAEEGEISLGKLSKPMDRYRQCVEQNGGLVAAKGSVQLNFLVRAELGRAEGVEIKRVAGVSQEVAKCLADVVDRRATGTPSSAMTGVTLTFEISETK